MLLAQYAPLFTVGKAQSLRNRVRSYWQWQTAGGETHRIRGVIDRVADVEYTLTDSVSEALLLKANFIKRYRPRFNEARHLEVAAPHVIRSRPRRLPGDPANGPTDRLIPTRAEEHLCRQSSSSRSGPAFP